MPSLLKTKLMVLMSSLFLALLLGELVARLSYPLYADFQSEFWQYSRRLKQRSPDPELGHQHRPLSRGRFLGVEIATDQHGLRHARPAASADNEKILLLGDSLALGWGVEYEKTYAYLLENYLKAQALPFTVANAGVGNFGMRNKLGMLKKLIGQMQVKLIILEFHLNDIEEVHYPSSAHLLLINHSYLYAQLRRWALHAGITNHQQHYRQLYLGPALVDFKKNLAEIFRLAREHKIPVLFFPIADLHQLSPYPLQELTNKVLALLPAEVPLVDPLPFLSTRPAEKLWVDRRDVHPNELGHGLLFAALKHYWDSKVRIHEGRIILGPAQPEKQHGQDDG